MNQLVQYDASVPAFLRNATFLQVNANASAGLSMGAPPRLSFRGSRFRFVAADGTETPLDPNGGAGNNSMSVDVVVLDASPHVSKFYYDKPYDPNSDDLSPVCFSDNGTGPSIRATSPQSLLCANCPRNIWGSKVTPQGTQVKACSDVKKLAVIPVSNIDGPAYVLNIPAASLKAWTAAVNAVSQRGIPIPTLVVRLGFDAEPAYPKLTFSPVRYISEQELGAVQDLFGSDEVIELVGGNDKAVTALPGTATQHATAQQAAAAQQAAPAPAAPPPPAQAAAPFVAPTAGMPETPAFLQRQPEAAPAPPQEAEKPKRRRRTAPQAAQADTQPTAQTPPQPNFAPAAAPTGGAPADLNALLDKVMAESP